MKELWITCLSVRSWNKASVWDDYLRAVETILGDRLTRLDVNDPIRRKADTRRSEGEFIINFGQREDSRWLWGKFEKTGIEFEVHHYKNGADSFGRLRENSVRFTVPERMAIGPNVQLVIELFRLSNERLDSFYAFADFKDVICSKKPSTPSLDVSRELLGIFWLTFFGSHYSNFFGHERLSDLEQASSVPGNGITLQLAETAGQVAGSDRQVIERQIGAQSFVGTSGTSQNNPFAPKESGKYALTLAQLSL